MASKEREKQILNEFRQALGRDRCVIEDDREEPDFALKLDGELVGMELIGFFLGEQGKNGSILLHRGRQLAQLKALLQSEQTGGMDALVSLEFHNHLLPASDKLKQLAGEIIGCVSDMSDSASSDGWVRRCNCEFRGLPLMSRCLTVVSYRASAEVTGMLWCFPSPQNIEVSDDFLTKLGKKIGRLPTYRLNLPACPMHLLIHADDDSDGSMSPDEEDLQIALHDWAAESGFDNVWFYARRWCKLYSIWPDK